MRSNKKKCRNLWIKVENGGEGPWCWELEPLFFVGGDDTHYMRRSEVD